ncbi:hypothetical protein OsI_26247 [Oryza sativa Indica Group]|uniref:Sugar phosphate transporter domain-containing protein n=1 Tax=Oryza sativa subsp. indica TaxID=39946 RepID=A2YLZ2_ORYSI|nr:hypothetical protein OsI_26247 [Oryza sativa Indica Group]
MEEGGGDKASMRLGGGGWWWRIRWRGGGISRHCLEKKEMGEGRRGEGERIYFFYRFMGAMISNLAFVFRNIFSKKGMKGKSVSGMNYYACLSMLSLVILLPFAFAMEGPKVWAAGWQKAVAEIGPNFVW